MAGNIFLTLVFLGAVSESIFILVYFLIFFVVLAFMLILAYMFKYPALKIFFMSLAGITIVVFIGLLSSGSANYLDKFGGLASIGNTYYILAITLLGTGGVALVVWLIYYAFTMFYKSKNLIPDD